MSQQEQDSNLTIQVVSFDRPTEFAERFYFLGMSTLQATTFLPPSIEVISYEIFAYTQDGKYFDAEKASTFRTIAHFNDFFTHSPEFYIHDCNIQLRNGLSLSSHDDGEVSIQFDS